MQLSSQFRQHTEEFRHDHIKRKLDTGVVPLKVWGLHDDDDDDLELKENTFEVPAVNIYDSVVPQEIFSIVVEHRPGEILDTKLTTSKEQISKHVVANAYLESKA